MRNRMSGKTRVAAVEMESCEVFWFGLGWDVV